MAATLVGIVNSIREVEGVTQQGARKGEVWRFLSMDINDIQFGHIWSCQLRADDKQYEEVLGSDYKGHKVKVTIVSQSASERTLKDGRTVMQIRSQITKVRDLGIPNDDDE